MTKRFLSNQIWSENRIFYAISEIQREFEIHKSPYPLHLIFWVFTYWKDNLRVSKLYANYYSGPEVPHFYGTHRFITVFIRPCHWTVS